MPILAPRNKPRRVQSVFSPRLWQTPHGDKPVPRLKGHHKGQARRIQGQPDGWRPPRASPPINRVDQTDMLVSAKQQCDADRQGRGQADGVARSSAASQNVRTAGQAFIKRDLFRIDQHAAEHETHMDQRKLHSRQPTAPSPESPSLAVDQNVSGRDNSVQPRKPMQHGPAWSCDSPSLQTRAGLVHEPTSETPVRNSPWRIGPMVMAVSFVPAAHPIQCSIGCDGKQESHSNCADRHVPEPTKP